MKQLISLVSFALVLALFVFLPNAHAVTLGADFAADYTIVDLGSVPDLPTLYGGLTLKSGDLNTLIIGGHANTAAGILNSVGVSRGSGNHITGFSGVSTYFADAAYNDGGVVYGPGGVLFTSRWPVNQLGQLLPGSTATDKIISLAPFGVAGSHAAINFVPTGLPGAGRMKLVSWAGGQFYDAEFAPDGFGTYDVTSVTQVTTIGGGPEGFVYVSAGSPGFPVHNLMVSEYSSGSIGTYEIDGLGNPIVATRRSFLSGLTGAEGAFIDPLTGDFLFSTFGGGNHVYAIRGFDAPEPPIVGGGAIPEPASIILIGLGTLGALGFKKRF